MLLDAIETTFQVLKTLGKSTPQIASFSATDSPRSLKEYTYVFPLADVLSPNSVVKPVKESDLEKIFNGKPHIMFLQHNDSTSWISALPVLANEWLNRSAQFGRDILPSIFFHKIVNSLPIAKNITRSLTGNTVSTYEEALQVLSSDLPYFMATCPEGSNCCFKYESVIADFQQYALIKAVLATHATCIVGTFTQTAKLAIPLDIPHLNKLKPNALGIRIPFYWMNKNKINARYEILEKPMSHHEFNALSKDAQNAVIHSFANQMKALMELRYQQISDGQI